MSDMRQNRFRNPIKIIFIGFFTFTANDRKIQENRRKK